MRYLLLALVVLLGVLQYRLWIADGSALSTWAPGDASPRPEAGSAALLVAASSDGGRLWVLRPDGVLATSIDGSSWVDAGSVPEAASMAASADSAYVVTPKRIYVVPA
jgi:photosystem II stability/assembly factor-like uncharacterized protein